MKHSRSFSSLSLLLVVSLVLTALPNLGPTTVTSPVSAAITDSQTISPPNLEEVEAEAPYTVSSNQDPMLTEIALRGSSSGRFGPFISNEPPAEYAHAYEPPISNDERTTCPKNGCDYVEGRLLIKFQPNVVSLDQTSKQALVQSDEILNSFETLGISNLTPVFPHAKSPEANSFISDVDGNLVPEPDLSLWYQVDVQDNNTLSDAILSLTSLQGIQVVEPDFIRRPIGDFYAHSAESVVESPAPSQVFTPGPSTDPLFADQWHIPASNVPQAWDYLESLGLPAGGSHDITIAVIDTGVDYLHPDLSANMWVNLAELNGLPGVDDDGNGYIDDIYGADTVQPDGDPMDDHGHGTHVAGIIAAQAGNNEGGVGIAYNTRIMALKAAQYSGVLASSDIAEAIYYAVTNGADVINMSFGSYARSYIEEDALTVAFGSAVLVAAAGNDKNVNTPCFFGVNMYPAAYDWVLGVMSRDENPNADGEYLSSFSNYDCIARDQNEYELMAPGSQIVSTLPGEQYAAWSGTSMAAPVVSGIAALVRTKWSDKSQYSSRFIMSQIAATGEQMLGKGSRYYQTPDALAALTTSPEPNLRYMQHWIFDSADIDPDNDEDGVVDAGEIVDLGIRIRNHWGQTTSVTATLEPLAEGAVSPDPYVTMLIDTVTYEPIGSFSWRDNGLIFSDEELIGVQSPFRFTTSADTPNDHVIPFKLTLTTQNGLDPEDTRVFTFVSRFYLMVQRGVVLPYIITEDMTLTRDNYWLVPGPTLIEEGATVTVTEGTQIQFYGVYTPETDPNQVKPYIQVEGNLVIAGSAAQPVHIFPGLGWEIYPIHILNKDNGSINISYAKIANPIIGFRENIFSNTSFCKRIDKIDHAVFYRGSRSFVWGPVWQPVVIANRIENTIISDLGRPERNRRLMLVDLLDPFQTYSPVATLDTVLFDNTMADILSPVTNSVFINNYRNEYPFPSGTSIATTGYNIHQPSYLRTAFPTSFNDKTYVLVGINPNLIWDSPQSFESIKLLAQILGGYPVAVSDAEESTFLDSFRSSATREAFFARYPNMNCGNPERMLQDGCWTLFDYVVSSGMLIGLTADNETCQYNWLSGEPLSYTQWYENPPPEDACSKPYVTSTSIGWSAGSHIYTPGVLELPSSITDEQLEQTRQFIIDNLLFKDFYNNAILNQWWDNNPNHWLRFQMDKPREHTRYITENYWGTSSTALIDQAIHDFYDDFNLGKFVYEPILVEAPETAYPFVTDVVISTPTEADTLEVGAEEVTFTVHFNRDMDQTVLPMVSFGPAEPYTDFIIDGNWTGPRTWVGTYLVTPATGNGYQFIRVADALAASDPWLVTGKDVARFRFNIIISGSAAMNLQASGGNGFVDLMWTQTDFDLLAGFNLYRSTSIDGSYQRLNNTILPPETRTYRDTDVVPGQPYFYKFTVVKTDMTESDFSNIASATPLDTIPPVLTHTPVASASPGMPLSLSATATDNVHVVNVKIYYRHVGETPYLMQEMTKTTGDNYVVTLPGTFMTPPGVEYYLEAFDGRNYTRSGRAEDPHLIEIDDTPVPTGISPIKGSVEGGTVVVIAGSNFQAGAEVLFGGAPASNVVLNSPNQITCTTPAHFPAVVDVRVDNPSGGYGTLLNAFTYEGATAQVSMPLTGGGQGKFVTVPVNAANFQGLLAASLEITFDPTIIQASSAEPGTLTAGFGYAVNLNTPGLVKISMSNPTMVSGDGSLALITFEVIGTPGSSSDLTIASHLFNDGAIPAEIGNGQFNVDNVFSVSGTVSYHNTSSPVGGVNLEVAGDVVRQAVSLPDGSFEVQGVPPGDYVLTASKTGNVNGITAYDASFVLQHEVGLIDLDDIERIAADVNANGIINAMDASYILQYAAGLISTPFPGAGSEWKFSPSSRSLPDLDSDVADQDFIAILVGDVSGNWTPNKGHLINTEPVVGEAVLTIPNTNILVGGSELIAVELDSQGGEVLSADLVLTYDPTHISIEAVSISPDANSWTLVSNLQEPGIIRIAAAGSLPLDANSELFVLSVKALGQANTSSTIVTSYISLNEVGVPATAVDGVVRISYPSLYLPLILCR